MEPITVNGEPVRYDLAPAQHVVAGLRRYFEEGLLPGSFLEALLSNQLKQACERADDINQRLICDWVKWLYNHAPTRAWGSPEAVARWVIDRREEIAKTNESASGAGAD